MSLPIFLSDTHFLSQLDKISVKEEYVRITVLDWRENPIQEIQGIVINGSVNLDGNSSMRRTASLTVFAEQQKNDLQNINSLFAINKKCKIEKGIKNTVPPYYNEPTNEFVDYQEAYGDIVWFPLGIYVMFNPAISHQMTGVNISMQLKDKMCLLNGDLGGQIHSPVEFSVKDEVYDNNGTSITKKYTLIYDIIKELVNHWGNEDLNKIFITEVPPMIKQVVKWLGKEPVYLVLHSDQTFYLKYDEAKEAAGNNQQNIITLQPGRDIGYIYTDFVYPGQLSCNAGETVTSVLDKLIGVMGNYEYFYDVQGNFIFQEKKNYLNMSNTAYWNKTKDHMPQTKEDQSVLTYIDMPYDDYLEDFTRLSKPVYSFSDNRYFTSYNNTLNYNNIKNDFIVWGSRKIGSSGTEKIIRFHLSIDRRPRHDGIYPSPNQSYTCIFYKDDYDVVRGRYFLSAQSLDKISNPIPYAFYQVDDKYYQYCPVAKESTVYTMKQFSEIQAQTESEYPKVVTISFSNDEQNYDWREQIYYQMLQDEKLGAGGNDLFYDTYYQYYAELKEEFPKIFDLETRTYKSDYYSYPDAIDYFLDMIDEDTQLGKYSINNIGKRTLVISDNNEGINCVFEPQIPDLVYVVKDMYSDQQKQILNNLLTGYHQEWIQIPSYLYESMMAQGGKFNSCYQKIKDLLYQYTVMNQTVSISSLPIYYLQPNTRITINDDASGIYGDYIIQSITLPLDISSTMSINAYKAVSKI